MKKTVTVILILSLIAALCGCRTGADAYVPTGNGLAGAEVAVPDDTPETEEILATALLYDADGSMNPYDSFSSTNRVLFSLIYQGLFTVDREYNVSPMICESYNMSTDMKTYTFHLCDALFSDGTAVTAADVAASLEAARGSRWYGSRLRHVTTVTAYGDAVVLELDTPMENLPLLLDIPIVKAEEVAAAQPLGSGPYRMDGNQLRRVAGWWCQADLCLTGDTVNLVAAGTAAQNRDHFVQDRVSLVYTDPAAMSFVDYHKDYELWECENGLFVYLACNANSSVFSNDAVRAALTHAIDRETLVEEFYHGFGRATQLPCSPMSPLYETNLASNYGYNPARFKTVLERENLAGSTVTLLLNGDDPVRSRVGHAIAEMLEEAGLIVVIQESTSADFEEDLKTTTGIDSYDLYLAQTRLSANMDLSAFFGNNTPLNYGGLSDPGIYAVSLDALANSGNFYNLYEMIMDDGQLCPLLFQSDAIFTQRNTLSDMTPARNNVFYYDLGRTMEDALIRE